ncbi:MAG: type II secretion system F family protein [Anaerolineales bacterium]|nr:type II secretion system F family protein [Anaerolineales bacterium]
MPLIMLIVGLGIIGIAIGIYIAIQGKNEVNERISQFIEAEASNELQLEDADNTYLSRFRRQFNLFFSALNSEEMQRKLIAANWQITVSEFLFIRLGIVLLSFLFGLAVLRSIFPGIGLALLAYSIPGFLLFRSIQARQKLFQSQLIDSLTLIRGAVEAGFSFEQSLNVVIQEMGAPTSEEFRQVRKEVALGLPLSRAFSNMASRMESDDFYLVVTVVNINMQVGGSLTTILSVVIETIRQRVYLLSEMRSLTAYANFAGYLLTLLPILTIAALSVLSPMYWEQLLQPGITRYILIYAICSLAVGNIVLRRMSKIQV